MVRAGGPPQRVAQLGVVNLDDLVGRRWGDRLRLGLVEYVLTRPILSDYLRRMERRAQIVLPKDAARIVFETGLNSGGRVLEAGVGSGGLTTVLAHAVAPAGRVYAYDLRSDHLDVGRRNVETAGWARVVDFKIGDVRGGVEERDLDAAVLDIPDPEAAIPVLHAALHPGAVLACYTPLIGQAERAAKALAASGYAEVRTLEQWERAWVIHERGARPDFAMLGHTGFLTFARRV